MIFKMKELLIDFLILLETYLSLEVKNSRCNVTLNSKIINELILLNLKIQEFGLQMCLLGDTLISLLEMKWKRWCSLYSLFCFSNNYRQYCFFLSKNVCCELFSNIHFLSKSKSWKIVIYQSFQQNLKEIYDLNHFRQEHAPFLDRTTSFQLKNAASTVLGRAKSTSLTEFFSIESKFTIDTLNAWFSDTIKSKFLYLDDFKKKFL